MNRYAVSDLHGQLDLYKQIKEYINNDDILYVLGDCNDRGPQPWFTLKAVIDDPQCILLMGNHEHMFWQAADFILEGTEGDINLFNEDPTWYLYNTSGRNSPAELLKWNGGWSTLTQWARESEYMRYLYVVKTLPLSLTIPTSDGEHYIYLSHAGYNPGEYRRSIQDMVWDRLHYLTKWEDYVEGDIVIHGHTPIDHLLKGFKWTDQSYSITNDGYGCCIYNDGFKYDIDLGAHFTGRTCLLNLDTLETKIFETEIEDEY